jgi:uncharacterized Tic20 family protein
MDPLMLRIGKWAAAISLLSMLVWFISFGMIAAKGPLFYWTTPGAYYEYVGQSGTFWANLAKSFMLVFSLAFLIIHLSLYEVRSAGHKFAGKIGLIFLGMFTLLSAMHYFIQLSSVRLSIEQGSTTGLEHFLQANPASFSLAVNMLGWTVMLGMASFFLGLMLPWRGRQKWIKLLYFLNAVFCLLAMTGFVLHIDAVTFPAINMGVGGCITAITLIGWKTLIREGNRAVGR